jgi:ATP-dependent Clp protease adaptor protein ClpS
MPWTTSMTTEEPTPGAPSAAVAEAPPEAPAKAPAPVKPQGKVEFLPPFRVLLHNDNHNIIQDVVRSIVQLTPLDRAAAVRATFEADRTGVALLLVTHKERAELYREQFASKRLTVTIEPAS